jgi:hypothetical protein
MSITAVAERSIVVMGVERNEKLPSVTRVAGKDTDVSDEQLSNVEMLIVVSAVPARFADVSGVP